MSNPADSLFAALPGMKEPVTPAVPPEPSNPADALFDDLPSPDSAPETVGTAEGTARGIGGALAQTGKDLALVGGGVVSLAGMAKNALTGSEDTSWRDAYFENVVEPVQESVDYYAPKPDEQWTTGAEIGQTVGNLAVQLAEYAAMPELRAARLETIAAKYGPKMASAALKVAERLAPKVAERLPQGARAARVAGKRAAGRGITHVGKAAPMGLQASVTQADRLTQSGVPVDQAIEAAAVNLPLNVGLYAAPPGLPGKFIRRAGTGAALGIGLPFAQQQVTHAIAPSTPAMPSLSEVTEEGLIGAGLSALFGGRARGTTAARAKAPAKDHAPKARTQPPEVSAKTEASVPGATPLADLDTAPESAAAKAVKTPEGQARIRDQIAQLDEALATATPEDKPALEAHRAQLQSQLTEQPETFGPEQEAELRGLLQRDERRTHPETRAALAEMTPAEKDAEIARLRKNIRTSPLTGLPNMAAFDEAAGKGLDVIGAADLDGLGWYNEHWGHEAADQLLREVGDAMRAATGDNVQFYHRSGDEFAVRGADAATVKQALATVQDALADRTFRVTTKDAAGHTVTHTADGMGISTGVGKSYHDADLKAIKSKQQREQTGLRAKKGAKPPGAITGDARPDYFDPRLYRDEYRHALEEFTGDLTPGGNMGLAGGSFARDFDAAAYDRAPRDKEAPVRRLPSTNPQWFQALAEREGVTVKDVQKAVDKALAGDKLGVRQQRVVRDLLDVHSERRTAEVVPERKQQLEQARQLRAVAKAGGRHTVEGPAFAPDSEWARYLDNNPGEAFDEAEYPKGLSGAARSLDELLEQAKVADEDAALDVALDRADRDISNQEAARRYWAIIEGRHGSETTQRESRQEPGIVQESGGRARVSEGAGEQLDRPPAEASQRAESATREQQGDLIGGRTATQQAVHDEARRRDAARNNGQQSVETGDAGDLFSQARQQVDLVDQAKSQPHSTFIGDASAGDVVDGVRIIGNFDTKAAAEKAAQASDNYLVEGYSNGKYTRGWLVREPVKSATPVFQNWKKANRNSSVATTRSGRFRAQAVADDHVLVTETTTGLSVRGPLKGRDKAAVAAELAERLRQHQATKQAPSQEGVSVSDDGVVRDETITSDDGTETTLTLTRPGAIKGSTKPADQEQFRLSVRAKQGSIVTPMRVEHFPTETEALQAFDAEKTRLGGQNEAPRQPTERIEDFGEHIAGARKDYAAKLADAADKDVAAVPLSQSWPAPDYQQLLDGGADPWAVAFIHAARDEVPAKPRARYKLSRWADKVQSLRDFASELLTGKISKQNLLDQLRKAPRLHSLIDRTELYQAVGHDKSLKGLRIAEGHYGMFNGVPYSPPKIIWSVEKKSAASGLSNWPRIIGQGDSREAAIADFKRHYAKLDDQPAKKQTRFGIFSRRGEPGYFIGKKMGRNTLQIEHFDDLKAARAYLNEHHDALEAKLKAMKDVPAVRGEANAPRVGVDYRHGEDVTPEQFSDEFGFRGVQFGNYVEQGRRQQDLNEAYDALMDLAAVIDVPAKALSLNGELGLAFGARGKGGKNAAKAHYESGNIVINLTKNKGAGSLAHEWLHAVDNYFSRMRGQKLGMMTERPYALAEGEQVRPAVLEAFRGIKQAINKSRLKQRSAELDKLRTKSYWTTNPEMTARAFESYVINKLEDHSLSNDYLANVIPESAFEMEGAYPYPTAGEIPAIRAAFDHFFQTLETKKTDRGVALYSRQQIAAATVDREAQTFEQARQAAKAFQGRELTNNASGIKATVSRNALDKMLSDKAVGKSESPAMHSLAVANLDQLFERSILGWSKPDRGGDPNIEAIHRFFTPMVVDGRARLVKMTVKEVGQKNRPNSLYTVEAVELDPIKNPAAVWVGEIANADGIDPRTIRSAGRVKSMAQRVQDFNTGDHGKLSAIGDQGGTLTGGSFKRRTPDTVRAALKQALGKPFEALERAKLVEIVPHEADLAAAAGLKSADLGGVQGVYYKGRIWLVADNIRPGHEAGVLLHEAGHRSLTEPAPGLREILGAPFDSLVRHFDRLHEKGNPLAIRAAERAAHDDPAVQPEERLMYFIEEAANAQRVGELKGSAQLLFKRVVSALKTWWVKTPFAKRLAAKGIELKLTPDDFLTLARQALTKQARAVDNGRAEGFQTRLNGDGTLKVFGDRQAIRAALAAEGVDIKGIPTKDGLTFGKSKVETVQTALAPRFSVVPTEFRADAGEPLPATDADVGATQPPAGKPPLHDRLSPLKRAIRTRADTLRYWGQDRFIDLKRIQEGIEEAFGALPDHLNPYRAEELYHGKGRAAIEDFREGIVKPLVDFIQESKLTPEQVGEWLYARHAHERNARIAAINPGRSKHSGMTDAEADAILKRYADNAAMQKIGTIMDNLAQRDRNLLVESGLESAETVAGWEQQYEHYVPLTGFEEARAEEMANHYFTGKGFSTTYRQKVATGRVSKAYNPFVNLLAQHEAHIVAAHKNAVGQVLLRFVEAHPTADLWEINKTKQVPYLDKSTGQVAYRIDKTLADNEVQVKVGGVAQRITFHGARGERFARAFKNLDAQTQWPIVRGLGAVNRYFALVNTGANPVFVLSNFLRDTQTAYIRLAGTPLANERGAIMADIPKAMAGIRQAVRKGKVTGEMAQWFEEYRHAGAKTGWLDAYTDVQKLTKALAADMKNAERHPLNPAKVGKQTLKLVEDYNSIVENAVRLSTYVHARKAGMSRTEAASLAKNLTVNFNRKGAAGTFMNSLYLFYNASVQGGVVVLQSLKHPKVRAALLKGMVAAAGLSIANRLIGGQDDDGEYYYDKIPDYVKDTNLVLMLPPGIELPDWMDSGIGGGKYLKIPLPYGFNVFKVMGDKAGDMASAAMGMGEFEPGQAALAVANAAMSGFNPLGSSPVATPLQFVSPTIGDTAVQIATGKTWYGAPMYPSKNPFERAQAPDSSQSWSSTSELAKLIAESANRLTGGTSNVPGLLDISPITLDLLFQTATGGAGRTYYNLADLPAKLAQGQPVAPREIPFVHRLLGETNNLRVNESAFYDNLTQLAYAKKELQTAGGDLKQRRAVLQQYRPYLTAAPALKAAEKRLKTLRDAIDRLQGRKLPAEFKRQRIQKLQSEMKRIMDRVNRRIEGAKGD